MEKENSLVKITSNYLKDYSSGSFGSKKVLAIFDSNTYELFYVRLKDTLFKNCTLFCLIIANGERDKSLASAEKCYNILTENAFSSSDYVISVGGGVVSDLGGFVAGTYNRGINHVIVPTTLLSVIDASIGGKTSINNAFAKNKIGIFYDPKSVLCDLAFLDSLPKKEWENGYGEVIKYAMLKGGKLLDDVILSIQDNMADIISECIDYKLQIVEADKFDKGVRHLLNFGHTVGHAIEKASGYNISHGRAVANGIVVELLMAEKFDATSSSVQEIAKGLVERYNLTENIKGLELVEYLKYDKKVANGYIDLITMKEVGKPKLMKVELVKAEKALLEVMKTL